MFVEDSYTFTYKMWRIGTLLIVAVMWTTANAVCKYPDYKGSKHTTCLPGKKPSVRVTLSDNDKTAIVADHNMFRGTGTPEGKNLEQTYWDDELEKMAIAWVERCVFEHDDNRWSNKYRENAGQNIAMGGKNIKSWAPRAWWNEYKVFIWGKGKMYQDKDIGHYTQMAMSAAVRVGCAEALCKNRKGASFSLFGCDYLEPNTWSKQYTPYTKGSRATSCESQFRKNGLCDCKGKYCANGGTMGIYNCTCVCTKYWQGDECTKERVCNMPNCFKSKQGCIHEGPFWTDAKCYNFKKDLSHCEQNTCDGICYGSQIDMCPFKCGLCNPESVKRAVKNCKLPTCLMTYGKCMGVSPFRTGDKCPPADADFCSRSSCSGRCSTKRGKNRCPYLCGVCKPGSATCKNLKDYCNSDNCTKYKSYMTKYCAKECNYCM